MYTTCEITVLNDHTRINVHLYTKDLQLLNSFKEQVKNNKYTTKERKALPAFALRMWLYSSEENPEITINIEESGHKTLTGTYLNGEYHYDIYVHRELF